MTDYSQLQDSPAGRRRRISKRRNALNEIAQAAGWAGWSEYETAVKNGQVSIKEKPTMNYYAAYNSYGKSFAYDSDGWSVHVFSSKQARNEWVSARDEKAETVSRKQAERISKQDRWLAEG